jgi:tRNA(fMet)-specific endonuclease VapC
MRILLDTNSYSDWRQSGRWKYVISGVAEVLIPVIVLDELHYGFQGFAHAVVNEGKLTQFLRNPLMRVVNVTQSTSLSYAHLRHFLRVNGTSISENDIWIVALALEHAVTANVHFQHLPQVLRVHE